MKKIIIINGPNLNLLGEREQSQYGKITFIDLENICLNESKKIGVKVHFFQLIINWVYFKPEMIF